MDITNFLKQEQAIYLFEVEHAGGRPLITIVLL